MTTVSTSNVVFVGQGFVRQLINENELFPESVDGDYTALGPLGRFNYGSGTYGFSVELNKIAVHHNSDEILSNELIQAARLVATALQDQKPGHGVTALGINFDTVLSQSDDGPTGTEFCAGLSDAERVRRAIASDYQTTQTQVIVFRGGVQYTLRLEPHVASRGANLFLGVNAHQDVIALDELVPKLDKASGARNYIESIRVSLAADFQG